MLIIYYLNVHTNYREISNGMYFIILYEFIQFYEFSWLHVHKARNKGIILAEQRTFNHFCICLHYHYY